MPTTPAVLRRARAAKNLLSDGTRPATDAGAARFIDERGFCLLMPIDGLPLPSLAAADGADPWAEEFRCTDRAWAWKETLPAQRLCAYNKLLRGRGTFISWRLYPAFLSLYGAGDVEEEYEAGRLGRLERDLALLVAEHGPVDSRDLWRRAKSLFAGKRHRFTAALDRLQTRFVLTVAGGSLEGWSRHTWDLVERQAPPGVFERLPSPREALRLLILQTIDNCAALPQEEAGRILGRAAAETETVTAGLLAEGLIEYIEVSGDSRSWVRISHA